MLCFNNRGGKGLEHRPPGVSEGRAFSQSGARQTLPRGPEGKNFCLRGPYAATPLCCLDETGHGAHVSEWTWLCANKTLLTKAGRVGFAPEGGILTRGPACHLGVSGEVAIYQRGLVPHQGTAVSRNAGEVTETGFRTPLKGTEVSS